MIFFSFYISVLLYFSPVHEAPEPEPVEQSPQQPPSVPNPPAESRTVNHPESVQNGENIHPDPVRQLLQDELFRLVQVCAKYPFLNSCPFIIHKILNVLYNIVLGFHFSCSKSTS